MSYVSFPISNAPVEANEETGQLELSQGWFQTYSLFNSALAGNYVRNKCTSNASVTANVFTPNISQLYIEYGEDVASDTLKFPKKLYGSLDIKDPDGVITQTYMCKGLKQITISNIKDGDTVTGTLTADTGE